MGNDPAARIARLLSDADIVFAVAASADGESLVDGGDIRHSGFESLLSMLIGDPASVRRTYEFLEGKLLPQSFAQGDAQVYLHKPREGIIVLTGLLLPRGDDSPESFAKAIYESGKDLDAVVTRHFASL